MNSATSTDTPRRVFSVRHLLLRDVSTKFPTSVIGNEAAVHIWKVADPSANSSATENVSARESDREIVGFARFEAKAGASSAAGAAPEGRVAMKMALRMYAGRATGGCEDVGEFPGSDFTVGRVSKSGSSFTGVWRCIGSVFAVSRESKEHALVTKSYEYSISVTDVGWMRTFSYSSFRLLR